jgi:hypothetical protein
MSDPEYCYLLEQEIANRDFIEYSLVHHGTQLRRCLPQALTSMINNTLANTGLSPVKLLDANSMLPYLDILWQERSLDNKLIAAVASGIIKIIPYLLSIGANPHYDSGHAISIAMERYPEILRLMQYPPSDIHGPRWLAVQL